MATRVTVTLRMSDMNHSTLTTTTEAEGEKAGSSRGSAVVVKADWFDMTRRICVIVRSVATEDSAGSGLRSFELSSTKLKGDDSESQIESGSEV